MRLTFALLFLLLTACTGNTGSKTDAIALEDYQFGFVDNGCWVVQGTVSTTAETVTVLNLETGQTISANTNNLGQGPSDCKQFKSSQISAIQSDLTFLELDADINFGVAWTGGPKGQSLPVEFKASACTTSEGLRYRVTDINREVVIWQGYQPLGYDTQSNCPS